MFLWIILKYSFFNAALKAKLKIREKTNSLVPLPMAKTAPDIVLKYNTEKDVWFITLQSKPIYNLFQ